MAPKVPNSCVTMERVCHPIIVRTIKWNNDLVKLDSRVAVEKESKRSRRAGRLPLPSSNRTCALPASGFHANSRCPAVHEPECQLSRAAKPRSFMRTVPQPCGWFSVGGLAGRRMGTDQLIPPSGMGGPAEWRLKRVATVSAFLTVGFSHARYPTGKDT